MKKIVIFILLIILIFIILANIPIVSAASNSSIRCYNSNDCDYNERCIYPGTIDSYCRERDRYYRYYNFYYDFDYRYRYRQFCGDGFCNMYEENWCLQDCSINYRTQVSQKAIEKTLEPLIIIYTPSSSAEIQTTNQYLSNTYTLKWIAIGLLTLFIFILLILIIILILRSKNP